MAKQFKETYEQKRYRLRQEAYRKWLEGKVLNKEEKVHLKRYWDKRRMIRNWELKNPDKKRASCKKYRANGRKSLGSFLRRWYGIWPSLVSGWKKYKFLKGKQ
jgi:hypothetical protein